MTRFFHIRLFVRFGRCLTSGLTFLWPVVTETFRDGFGRVTETVRCVWKNGARDSASTYDDPANAVSLSLSYAGSGSGQIPEELWDLPLYEEHEDGSTSLWFYAFGNYNSETHSFAENADGLCLRSVQAATEKKL